MGSMWLLRDLYMSHSFFFLGGGIAFRGSYGSNLHEAVTVALKELLLFIFNSRTGSHDNLINGLTSVQSGLTSVQEVPDSERCCRISALHMNKVIPPHCLQHLVLSKAYMKVKFKHLCALGECTKIPERKQ